jgi:hypothetical protein
MRSNFFGVTRRHTFLTAALVLIALTAHGADMNRLSDHQWKNRLILVQAESENNHEIETLRKARAEVDDRDVVWFVNTGLDLVSNQKAVSSSLENDIKSLFEKTRLDDRVLLIGKDGGIKSRDSSLDLDAIFRRIDAMPMRIREMRTNRNSASD